MIILLIILLLTIFLIIYNSKTKEQRNINIKRLVFIFLGIISFILLVRIIPPIFAFISGAVIAIVPFIDKLLRIGSYIAIVKSIITLIKKPKNSSTITENEAYDILDIDNNASEEEIKSAYKKKMKNNHPDKGGSDYFAVKLTEARDLLLTKLRKK